MTPDLSSNFGEMLTPNWVPVEKMNGGKKKKKKEKEREKEGKIIHFSFEGK